MKVRSGASFRDPDGFIYNEGGDIFRQINLSYRDNYELLMGSGLYEELTGAGLLVRHEELPLDDPDKTVFRLIKPEKIPFISYPYEWSFSQIKDAALLTLKVQKLCLEKGVSLKDASAYNIQFRAGAPVFIDTLYFERYKEGTPWAAYGQFCRHFLAPLCLASKKDPRLMLSAREYIDGIPLDLASRLLPWQTCFNPGILFHLHFHAMATLKFAGESIGKVKNSKISRFALLGIIESLESTIKVLKFKVQAGQWADYYGNTDYTRDAFEHKKAVVSSYLGKINSLKGIVWDLGANTGTFSRLASGSGFTTVSFDLDHAAVEKNYTLSRTSGERNPPLPLVMDLFNQSPALGWSCCERESLMQRGPCGCAMALALVHHLAITNNLPLTEIARFFSEITMADLIIEFVPPEDPRAAAMFENNPRMKDIYNIDSFEDAFCGYFRIVHKENIKDSSRILYLMARNT